MKTRMGEQKKAVIDDTKKKPQQGEET